MRNAAVSRALGLSVLAVLLATLPRGAQAAPPFFSGIGDLPTGRYESNARAVSNGGVVVGQGWTAAVLPYSSDVPNGAIWTQAGGLVAIGYDVADATDVSADGQTLLVDNYELGISEYVHHGAFVPLPSDFNANALSADGTAVVGSREIPAQFTREAARWTEAGGVEGLGFLFHANPWSDAYAVSDDSEAATGAARNYDLSPGFHWTAGEGMVPMDPLDADDFPGANVTAISGRGDRIAGYTGDGAGFVWSLGSGYVPLGNTFSPGIPKIPRDVDRFGNLVVGGNFAAAISSAFLWDPMNGMRELRALLENDYGLDLTGWTLLQANAISPNGRWIVGMGLNPNGDQEGWVAYLGSRSHCGLGAELSLVLAFLAPLWRRRHPRAHAELAEGPQ